MLVSENIYLDLTTRKSEEREQRKIRNGRNLQANDSE